MNKRSLWLIILLALPLVVYASSGNESIPLLVALVQGAFFSIPFAIFVFLPLAKIYAKDNYKVLFWKMFGIRVLILLVFDFFISTAIVGIDFFLMFMGTFVVVPLCTIINKKVLSDNNQSTTIRDADLKCLKCGTILKITDKSCPKCHTPFTINNSSQKEGDSVKVDIPPKKAVSVMDYDNILFQGEEQMLEMFINRNLTKCGISTNSKLITQDALKKKYLLQILWGLLLIAFVALIFFHFPLYTYIIGIVLLFVLFHKTRKFDLLKYFKKQIQSRPEEKISNIIMNAKNTFVEDRSQWLFLVSIVVAVVFSLIFFAKPHIMYEKMANGYGVRFYTFGITNFTKATIPESYKGKSVISLRGNTFSNMPLLKEVSLPKTITEIRGQAFKNDFSLKKIELPPNLEYLGGGAFYNCKSLKSIELPDSLTYMGGETFYHASSLVSVKLSNNLSEIRGDSFSGCKSLTKITIPDKVERIGGHAFYEAKSLAEVNFTKNSQLAEIGSSAFRLCLSLDSITLPYGVDINERAFKESPTVIHYFNEDNYNFQQYEEVSQYATHTLDRFYIFNDITRTVAFDTYGIIVTVAKGSEGYNNDFYFQIQHPEYGRFGIDRAPLVDSKYLIFDQNAVSIDVTNIQLTVTLTPLADLLAEYSNVEESYLIPNNSFLLKNKNITIGLTRISPFAEKVEYGIEVSGEITADLAITDPYNKYYYINDNLIIGLKTVNGLEGATIVAYYN